MDGHYYTGTTIKLGKITKLLPGINHCYEQGPIDVISGRLPTIKLTIIILITNVL